MSRFAAWRQEEDAAARQRGLEERAMSVWCTLCGRLPHQPCVSTATEARVNAVPHQARIDNYERIRRNDGN